MSGGLKAAQDDSGGRTARGEGMTVWDAASQATGRCGRSIRATGIGQAGG